MYPFSNSQMPWEMLRFEGSVDPEMLVMTKINFLESLKS